MFLKTDSIVIRFKRFNRCHAQLADEIESFENIENIYCESKNMLYSWVGIKHGNRM